MGENPFPKCGFKLVSDITAQKLHPSKPTEFCRKIYQAVYDHHRGPWPNAPQKRRQQVLSVLHLLRAVCNHPACLDANRQASLSSLHFPSRDDVEASGKCAKLHEILENVNENEKILVFNVSLAPIDLLMEQIQKSKRGSRGRNVLKLVGEMNAQKREAFGIAKICETF